MKMRISFSPYGPVLLILLCLIFTAGCGVPPGPGGGTFNRDIVIVKLAEDGSTAWTYVINYPRDNVVSLWVPVADGGVLINQGTVLIRLSNNGTLLWDQNVYGECGDYLDTLKQTRDRGFITTGTFIETGDQVICKIDSVGKTEWARRDLPFSIISSMTETDDGGFLITANRVRNEGNVVSIDEPTGKVTVKELYRNTAAPEENYPQGSEDFKVSTHTIAKLDHNRNISWLKRINSSDFFSQITNITSLHAGNGFNIQGFFFNQSMNRSQFRTMNITDDGIITNITTTNLPTSQIRTEISPTLYRGQTIPTRDGGNLIVRIRNSRMSDNCVEAQKISSRGNTEWNSLVTAISINHGINDIVQTDDGGYVIIGENNNPHRRS